MGSHFRGDDVALCLSKKIEDKSLATLMKLGLSDRFPNEFSTWERGRDEIMQRFQETLIKRQKEMHTVFEQDFADIKVRIREAVIIEVLKTFP
jgi:hypothetical protein